MQLAGQNAKARPERSLASAGGYSLAVVVENWRADGLEGGVRPLTPEF